MRPPWYWGRRQLTIPDSLVGDAVAAKPTVVHVVRAANGVQAVRAFAQAMRRHDAGVEYELVLAMKGFASEANAAVHLEAVADLSPQALYFPDVGFDLGVFFGTAGQLRRGHYCFMNSWSHPVKDGWLAKLNDVLCRPDVGMVGPCGSWSSMRSWLLYTLGLPSAYRQILPPPREGRRLLRDMDVELRGAVPEERFGTLRTRLQLLRGLPEMLLDFDPFPNPHLRTASFMIPHAVLARLELFAIANNRVDTYALESGRASLTRQVQRLGLRVLVVDGNDRAYGSEQWDRSDTYRQGDQEGLLIADRRTLEYERGNPMQRELMSRFCWGEHARPRTPRQLSATGRRSSHDAQSAQRM